MEAIETTARVTDKTTRLRKMKMRILVVAERVYREAGSQIVSVGDLAKEMHISKKTIYQCFDSKASLLDDIVSQKIAFRKAQLEEKIHSARNPIQEAFIAWHLVEEFIGDFNAATIIHLKKSFRQSFGRIAEFKHHFLYAYFKSNLERGMADGLYRATIKSEIIAGYLVEVLFMPRNLQPFGHPFSPAEVDYQLLTYHLHGLATEKGMGLIRSYKNEALGYSSRLSA